MPSTSRIGAAPPFVGRDRELDDLRRSLDAAAEGERAVVLLGGDAGIGKTRLSEEFAAHARDHGFDVVWGRCWEGPGGPAYWPWIQALRELQGDAGLLAADRTGDEVERLRLFEAVASVVARRAVGRPLALLFDDLHDADVASVLLLRFVAHALFRSPVVVVGTYREVEARRRPDLAGALHQLARLGHRLSLRGLPQGDVATVVQSATGREPSEQLAAAIHRATGGNPFFVDEVARLLRAEPERAREIERGRMTVPDGVRAAIRHRLELLDAQASLMLPFAAVLGQEFDDRALASAAELTPDALIDGIDDAVRTGILVEVSAGRHAFVHSLFRETIYDDVPASRRAHLHMLSADVLEELDPVRLDEIAHHVASAGPVADPGRATDVLVRAATRAMSLLAYEDAADHLERALQLLPRGEDVRRCELLIALGDAKRRSGAIPRARATLREATQVALRAGAAEHLALATLSLAGISSGVEPDEDLIRMHEQALRAIGPDPTMLRVRLLNSLARALYFARDEGRRAALATDAIETARSLGQPELLAQSMLESLLAQWEPGNVDQRLAAATEIVRLAREAGNKALALHGRNYRVIAMLELGMMQGAFAEAEQVGRLAEEVRLPQYRWNRARWHAMRAILEGRFDEAETLAAEALRVGQEQDHPDAVLFYGVQLFAIRREQGRLAELEDTIATLVDRQPAIPTWRCALASVYAATGRSDEARAQFDHLSVDGFSRIPYDLNWLVGMALLAEVCAALQDAQAAETLFRLLEPHARRAVVAAAGSACLGASSYHLGLVAATAGRTDDAVRHLSDAVEMNRRMGAVPAAAHAEAALARVRTGTASREARFERDGAGWTVTFQGATARLPNAKGLLYIALLLRNPGYEFHALELVGLGAGTTAPPAPAVNELTRDGALSVGRSLRAPVLDDEARRAYRRRLDELREELEEARAWDDPERAARARAEIEAIGDHLSAALGLAGRPRDQEDDAERARKAVTNRIRDGLARIRKAHPTAADQLHDAIRTGTFCSYTGAVWDVRI